MGAVGVNPDPTHEIIIGGMFCLLCLSGAGMLLVRSEALREWARGLAVTITLLAGVVTTVALAGVFGPWLTKEVPGVPESRISYRGIDMEPGQWVVMDGRWVLTLEVVALGALALCPR